MHGAFSPAETVATTKEAVRDIVRQVVRTAQEFFPETALHHGLGYEPLVLGNNDFARDYGELVTDPTKGVNPWFYSLAATGLSVVDAPPLDVAKSLKLSLSSSSNWSPLDEQTTFLTGGYGMRKLSDGLYVVSLNTVVYSTHFFWEGERHKDPFGQFHWLEKALQWLRHAQVADGLGKPKALITGHIPPTLDNYHFAPLWSEEFVDRYMDLVAMYDDVVAAQMFAHTHCDTFRLVPSRNSTHPIFISSALSPVYENNPSFRVWRYRGSEVLDFTVYAADLDKQGPQKELVFRPLYSARAGYGLASLSAKEWRSKVLDQLTVDPEIYRRYLGRVWQMTEGEKVESALHDEAFLAKTVCSMQHVHEAGYSTCIPSSGVIETRTAHV